MTQLTHEQKLHLYEHGYVIIPNVVSNAMINEAIYAVNTTVEGYLDSIQTRASELKSDERLKNLLMKTGAFSLVESAMGKGMVIPSTNIQAALRFPDLIADPTPLIPHIDSFHPSTEKDAGSIKPFGAIAGFF